MLTAFVYAYGKGISDQFKEIENYSRKKGIKLVNKYFDSKDLSGKHKFNKMIRDALDFPPNYIITLRSEYISNDKETLDIFKNTMKELGIEILYLNEINLDADLKNENLNEFRYENIKFKIPTISLKEKEVVMNNIEVRSEQKINNQHLKKDNLKIIYKTTHHVPYGYKVKKIGQRQYLWEQEEEEVKTLRKILVNLYAENGYSYQDIRDWLNEKGIVTKRNQPWSTSSVVNLLKKDRLDIYSGIGNDLPVISSVEYDKIIKRKSYNSAISIFGRTKHSSYILTGPNIGLESMFVCKSCGSNIIGYKNSSKTWSHYICSNYRNNGTNKCSNDWYLAKDKIEDALWQVINRAYLDKENFKRYKEEILKNYKENSISFTKGMKVILKNLIDQKIEIKDIVGATRDADEEEQREIVRLFVEKIEMDNSNKTIYMKLYGSRQVKIQF